MDSGGPQMLQLLEVMHYGQWHAAAVFAAAA